MINLLYGGQPYSVGGRDLDDLLAEITAGLASDEPRWLTVNSGEGRTRPALLSLTRGVDITVIPVPGDDDLANGEHEASSPAV